MVIDLVTTLWVVLVSAGVSFVVTGSTIMYPIRLLAFHTLGKLTWGPIHMDSLFRCPFCNAWWGGLALSFALQLPWWTCLANAFVACLAMGVAQAQWGLAAHDDFDTQDENVLTRSPNDGAGHSVNTL
jgi:hypothetical protein